MRPTAVATKGEFDLGALICATPHPVSANSVRRGAKFRISF
jgi:hypothetical protein